MRKYVIVGCLWFMVLTVHIASSSKEIRFEIKYDTQTKETYEIKDKVLEIYKDLIEGIQDESQVLIVMHNLKKFEFRTNMKASWENNQLHIMEGNGKGDVVHGELKANSYCLPKVQPRSFLQELFS